MSKNLTRKGYAFGALVALGASVFAGAPAYAADSVVLAANTATDTTLAVPVTETIALNASLAPGSTAANISQLKYKLVTDGTFVLSVAAGTGNVSVNGATAAATSYTNNTTSVTGVTTGVFGSGGTVKTTSYVALATAASPTAANTLTLGVNAVPDATVATTGVAPTSATATKTATVTAFLDSNNNSLFDTGETSQTVDVKFVKYSEITSTTTITAPTQGSTTVSALVKFTNINNEAVAAANVGAYFTKGDGTSLVAADGPIAIASGASNTLSSGVNTVVTGTHTWTGTPVVVVAGLTPSGLNGTYTTTAVTSTSVSYTNATATGTTSTAGTVRRINSGVVKFNVAYSSTLGGFSYTTGTVDALAKASAVKVQPIFKNGGAGVADFASSAGTAATAQVATRSLGEFGGNTVASTTAFVGTVTGAVTTPSSSTVASNVALNGEKQVAFLAKDTATTPAALAGQAVAVTVTTSVTLSATKTLTVNGTTYTSNAALPGATGVAKLALTTGADGKAVVTYKTAGYAYSDTVTVLGAAENSTATIVATERTRNFIGTAGVTGDGTTGNNYSTYIANHEGNTATTVDGTAVKVDVVVQDQFGGIPADGTYQVTASFTSSSQATLAATSASATYAAVVGGKATLTILDNGTGNGANVYAIDLREVATNGVLSNSVKAIAAAFTINIASAADVAAGEVVLTAANASLDATTGQYAVSATNLGASDGAVPLTYSDFKSVDGRSIAYTAPANTDLAAAGVTGFAISGTVNSASTSTYGGVAVPGATVTVSGTGLQFAIGQDVASGENIYGSDSLTFVANATGQFTIKVWSHVAGKNLVTVKSGTGSAVFVLYFAAAAETAATTVAVKVADGAAQFQAGRALDVAFTVTDKFGNPVALNGGTNSTDAKLTIAQAGSGYLALTGDQTVGATGVFTTKLITNAGDLGTSTITATVDFYSSLKTDLVKTVSSEFGVTDADVTVGGRAVYASVEFAKGKTVTVSVDGRRLYSKLFSTDAYTELKFTQKTAGKHVVTVRVSGGIVYSETVVTTK